jgi:hypothetical protein
VCRARAGSHSAEKKRFTAPYTYIVIRGYRQADPYLDEGDRDEARKSDEGQTGGPEATGRTQDR